MTEPSAEIVDIIIDCIDPERVATFGARLLDRPIEGRKRPHIWLRRAKGSVGVSFQRAPEPKRGKNRVHFDISGPDIRHLENHIESIGGHRVELYDGGFLVMGDPEGNEFCVVPVDPIQLDEEGRTLYPQEVLSKLTVLQAGMQGDVKIGRGYPSDDTPPAICDVNWSGVTEVNRTKHGPGRQGHITSDLATTGSGSHTPRDAALSWAASSVLLLISTLAARWLPAPNMVSSPGSPDTVGAARCRAPCRPVPAR